MDSSSTRCAGFAGGRTCLGRVASPACPRASPQTAPHHFPPGNDLERALHSRRQYDLRRRLGGPPDRALCRTKRKHGVKAIGCGDDGHLSGLRFWRNCRRGRVRRLGAGCRDLGHRSARRRERQAGISTRKGAVRNRGLGQPSPSLAGWKVNRLHCHPFERDDAGSVATVDQAGNKKTLTGQFVSAQGLAWAKAGNEVWFTGTTSGSSRELRAVTLSGKERLVYLGTGTLTLHDIFRDDRVLFSRDDLRAGMIGLAPGEKKERDLSWHDWTVPRDLSDDGKLNSFDETGEAGGETGALYVRSSDGSPAVRLGEGRAPTLSPDGKWALARGSSARHELLELPTGAGDSRIISTGEVQLQYAYFFPDARHILEVGSVPGHGLRLWIQDSKGGAPQPISPEGAIVRRRKCISPDGKRVAARDPDGKITVYPVDGGKSFQLANVQPGEEPVQWTLDGKALLVGRREVPARIFMINLLSNERKLLQSFMPADPTGLFGNASPTFSSDLKSYVYSYQRITSDLYIVDGLK